MLWKNSGLITKCHFTRWLSLSHSLLSHTHTHTPTDLYFTRVVPSKQFDLLPEDFDFTLVAAVVGALVAATFVLSRLSRRKLLKLIWK